MRSRTNRAIAKINKSLNIIAGILAQNEELRQFLFYPADSFDDSLELIDRKTVMEKCTDIVVNYPDRMEAIGAFLVIGVPEMHVNEKNSKFMDIVLTIDVMIHENSEKFGVGLRVFEITDLIDYLLNETDIQGIGKLKLTDLFFQVYTPGVRGYTMVFHNRDMN
ncbi:MAG: hypothetical protein KQ78_01855 [Candidatus Izimaplasma bacterium HR2]|nr:MAG: hypothetical protein KQ78_01855 [Candidatus Izimaplasma bacterium HR2]